MSRVACATSTSADIVPCNDLTVVAGFEETLRANGWDSLDALMQLEDGETLRKPGLQAFRERVRLRSDPALSGEMRTFYLKRYVNPPARAQRAARRCETGAQSLAGVEWSWMLRLAADGVPCAQPVAFGERLDGSRERCSAMLTEAVPGSSLETWVKRWSPSDRSTIRPMLDELATVVARLHGRGYVHRDLYLSHVFYDPDVPVERSLHLIDLQRVFRPAPAIRRRWIVKDLAALNYSAPFPLVTSADRVRWLTRYLSAAKLDRSARQLLYRVVGRTQQMARHDRRRKRRWSLQQ